MSRARAALAIRFLLALALGATAATKFPDLFSWGAAPGADQLSVPYLLAAGLELLLAALLMSARTARAAALACAGAFLGAGLVTIVVHLVQADPPVCRCLGSGTSRGVTYLVQGTLVALAGTFVHLESRTRGA